MPLTALGVDLAAVADLPRTEALAIGAVTARVDASQSVADVGLSLIETLAYVGDVLSAEQDHQADEGFLETSRASDEDLVRIRFPTEVLPAVFVAIGDDRAFVVVVGTKTGDSTVRFGDGDAGARPPMGLERVAATYRHGGGHKRSLELHGLRLGRRWAVVAISHRTPGARGLICSIHR
jgi:hypothetical protein